MAAEPVFVDTNVLVYVTRPSAQHHVAAKDALAKLEFAKAALSGSVRRWCANTLPS